MPDYGEQVLEQLEGFVERVEQATAAELVFVLAHRAERYPDVPFKLGALTGLLALGLVIFLPVEFGPEWLLLDVVLGFGLGWGLGWAWPGLARVLTRRGRRRAAVERTARAVFTERGVGLTRERTGVLVFVAWLEREIRVMPDVGIERHVPLGDWKVACKQFERADLFRTFPDGLPGAFEPLRALLEKHLPRPEDDTDEIPNRPVVME